MRVAVERPSRQRIALRIAWTVISLIIVQAATCGLAAIPLVVFWLWLLQATATWPAVARAVTIALAAVPGWIAFAILLMYGSPLVLRLVGWRSPERADLPIASMDWPLLTWARFNASLHVVRVIAGTWFRGTPLWSAHLRLCGARVGRRVFINTLAVGDYNLLEFGDDVVIGDGVHISGHTVERGVVKTGRVRLGSEVTVGLGSVIDIGVDVGPQTVIGAFSFVPKHVVLQGHHVYAGVPAAPLH